LPAASIFFRQTVLRPPAYNIYASLSKEKSAAHCRTTPLQKNTTMQLKKMKLSQLTIDLQTYFTWSFNALFPFGNGADTFLLTYRQTIHKVAGELLKKLNYQPTPIYRGVLLKQPVTQIAPHPNLVFLPFSEDRQIAESFATVNGFASEIKDLGTLLGKYGYIITYTPTLNEILYHYHLLDVLPYEEAFYSLGVDGHHEVAILKRQKEISIFQPVQPFTTITRHE
jgi:hypothetical protein